MNAVENEKQDIRLYVVYHKPSPLLQTPPFVPIQVGKGKPIPGVTVRDNVGENIAEKNPNFCELTAQYWIWKNVQADIVGLCHYRRIPSFSDDGSGTFTDFSAATCEKFGWNTKKISELFQKYDILMPLRWDILPPGEPGHHMTPYEFYAYEHRESDLAEAIRIIHELTPEVAPYADSVLNTIKAQSFCNVCVMRKTLFDAYSEWLFRVLFELERRIEIPHNKESARLFGFLSEHLIMVWLAYAQEKLGARVWFSKVLPLGDFPEPQVFNRVSIAEQEVCINPILSIIIPVYNAGERLYRCLNSVCGQCEERIEIICVNDGSVDNSREILAAFAAKDKRICILDQNHKGEGSARNLGIERAKGKYLTFVEATDWVDRFIWYRSVCKAERFSLDMVFYDVCAIVNESGKTQDNPQGMTCFDWSCYRVPFSWREIGRSPFDTYTAIYNRIIRRDFLGERRFLEGLGKEDAFLHLALLFSARQMGAFAHPYYCHRTCDDKRVFPLEQVKMKLRDMDNVVMTVKQAQLFQEIHVPFLHYVMCTLVQTYQRVPTKVCLKLLQDWLFSQSHKDFDWGRADLTTRTLAHSLRRGDVLVLKAYNPKMQDTLQTLVSVRNRIPCRGYIKQFIPYGLMCIWLHKRYGIEKDQPILAYPGFWKRAKRLLKFVLPFGLVETWKQMDATNANGTKLLRRLLRPGDHKMQPNQVSEQKTADLAGESTEVSKPQSPSLSCKLHSERNDMPLVSLIVPTYKAEQTIRACLDSILAQTYCNLEIIVVNDGSPDNCLSIVDEYKSKDKRIILVHQANGGYGKAVNDGIKCSHGEYIGIVNSSDTIEPTLLEELVRALKRHNAEVVRCAFLTQRDRSLSLSSSEETFCRLDGQVINPRVYTHFFDFDAAPWCYLCARSVFSKLAFTESRKLSPYQGVSFIVKLLLTVDSVAVVGKPLVHHCVKTHDNKQNVQALIECYSDIEHFMRLCGVLSEKKFATILLRKALQNISVQCITIKESEKKENYPHLSAYFTHLILDLNGKIDWSIFGLTERLWLWTLLSGHAELTWPVVVQNPDMELVRKIVAHAMKEPFGAQGSMLRQVFPPVPVYDGAVPVLMSADRNYFKYASVTWASVMKHASESRRYHWILLVDFDVDYSDEVKLRSLFAGRDNVSLSLVDMRQHFLYALLEGLFVDRHLSKAAYYRFVAPYVCYGYDKCVYLDCDVVLCEDIANLYDTDMSGFMVAGCTDHVMIHQLVELHRLAFDILKSCGYTNLQNYICSGVMVFNLKRMDNERLAEKLVRVSAANNFLLHDQDAVNLVCQNCIKVLDDKWGLIMHENPTFYPVMDQMICESVCRAHKGILHFAGDQKPWLVAHEGYAWVWWQSARQSPYYEELLQLLVRNEIDKAKSKWPSVVFSSPSLPTTNTGTQRPIKYLLPYGFMYRWLKSRYGIIVDQPLFFYPGFFKRMKRVLKFTLPFGVVEAWKRAADNSEGSGCFVAVVRKLLRPRRG